MISDDEVEVEYELESFVIGGKALDITTIAYLPIEMLMANREKEKEISGQKLWCGSLGVIQYLLNYPLLVHSETTVIELGAGTGVLGMICKARFGADSVYLTDHDLVSIKHMKADLARNNIEAKVCTLDWHNPNIDDIKLDLHSSTAGKDLLIVAGDVLYKRELLNPFFNMVQMLMSIKVGTTMLLCHIPRAGVDQADVTIRAQEIGFQVDEIPVELWNIGECFKYCDENDLARARLYKMQLPL